MKILEMSRLSQRFESFVKTLDGFESIDALLQKADPPGKKRADYLLQNRQVVLEQKALCSNPIEKPQKFVDKLARERGIRMYGRVSTDQVFAGQPDPQDLQRRMVLDLTRVIRDNVADADKQTADTRQLFNIPNAVGILVLLNESANVLQPDVIHYALSNSFQKRFDSGGLRYPANDGVILFQSAFAILSFTSPHKRQAEFITQFSNMLRSRWVAFNNGPPCEKEISL